LGHEADPVALGLHLVGGSGQHLQVPQASEHHREQREGDDSEHAEAKAWRLGQRHHRANAPPLTAPAALPVPSTAQRTIRSASGASTALSTAAMATTAARCGRMSWLSPTTAPAMANSTSPAAVATSAVVSGIHQADRRTPS